MHLWRPDSSHVLALDRIAEDVRKNARNPASAWSRAPTPSNGCLRSPRNVQFVDMTEYFCDGSRCPGVIGNVIVYSDDSHITATYSRTLAPMLARKLTRAWPPGWVRMPTEELIADRLPEGAGP
jgi:hypothetical protein